ncbi:Myb domain-containing protein [Dioscorea alata]|uniref:Myb domain-containing protein n=3 Tax=Dioscorea alata TaxID=55571 RepID=A0ACB7WTM5_DIOAL|nr:Myb domain-containing protein [Dioscorea alata]KAH7691800.1 Myb domain-containing protein [Dioscorea alata]KAH7691801.1 Myb domain-containing protein [Dioscorea alata]
MVEEVKKEHGKGEKVQGVVMTSWSPASDGSFEMKACAVPGRGAGRTRRSTKGGWTDEEDDILATAVRRFNGKNWKKIAEYVPDRTDVQCLHRWQKVLNPDLVKGAWAKEEDDCIIKLVDKYGPKKWSLIAQSMPGRIGKQCRERWHNHLNPAIKKDAWTTEEEMVLIHAHQVYGNKWAEIAKLLPGRADNSIKNHWNCSLKKRLPSILASGILDQTPGLASLDLNGHLPTSECQPVKPSQQQIKQFDRKRTINKSSVTPEACLDDQDLSLGFQDFGLQPVVENSIVVGPENREITIEDSKRLKIEVEEIPLDDPKCIKIEAIKFAKHLQCGGDKGPASYPNNFLYKDASPCRNDLLPHVTNLWRIEDSNHSGAADDSHVASVLQPKAHNFVSNPFFSHSEFDRSFSNKMLESPKKLWSCEFVIKDENKKYKDKNVSQTPTTVLSSYDKLCGGDQIIRTPISLDNSTFCPLYCSPLQLAGNEISLVNSRKSDTDVHIKQKCSPVQCSMPSNLSLSLACVPTTPESILRSAAKTFKNIPSIMRKRGRESSKVLFPKNFPQARCEATKTDGSDDSSRRVANIENDRDYECVSHHYQRKNLFDLNKSDMLNGEPLLSYSSEQPLKSKHFSTTKCIEKKLEMEFDLEWDACSL